MLEKFAAAQPRDSMIHISESIRAANGTGPPVALGVFLKNHDYVGGGVHFCRMLPDNRIFPISCEL